MVLVTDATLAVVKEIVVVLVVAAVVTSVVLVALVVTLVVQHQEHGPHIVNMVVAVDPITVEQTNKTPEEETVVALVDTKELGIVQ